MSRLLAKVQVGEAIRLRSGREEDGLFAIEGLVP
jgi:hypothetical protein